MSNFVIWSLIIVFILGLLWGFLEIVVRYDIRYLSGNSRKRKKISDNQDGLIDKEENAWWFVLCYLILNGSVSAIAFFLLKFYMEESLSTITTIDIESILIASFGGMIILRSSIFSIIKDNKEISIGFMTIVQSLLGIIDKKIRHNIAAKRMCEIYEIMKEVDYEKAKEELPDLCVKYIDNFNEQDSKDLINAIKVINGNFSGINKSLQLGREISRYCDIEILKRAVKKLPIKNEVNLKNDNVGVKDDYEKMKEQLNKQ